MAQLSLQQISNKLNTEFQNSGRKLVFWYDENAEFESDIHTLELTNAKLLTLLPDEAFQTKVLLERKDTNSNYLIYAPFKRPLNRQNHLADTILYSTVFSADRITLIMTDLKIDEMLKPVLEEHKRFFDANDRREKFYKLEIDSFTKENLEVSMMSVLTKSRIPSFESVLRVLLTDKNRKDSEYMAEFNKYNLQDAFWELCKLQFGYSSNEPNLTKLLLSMFLTYTQKKVKKELPRSSKELLLPRPGTVITFIDQLMNDASSRKDFDRLSNEVYNSIKGETYFSEFSEEEIFNLDIFSFVDKRILSWINKCLLNENTKETLDGKSIPDIIRIRLGKHFSDLFINEYKIMKYAYEMLKTVDYSPKKKLLDIIKDYTANDYLVDMHYRKFYYYHDRVADSLEYESLTQLIENVYVSCFLDPLDIAFNAVFNYEDFFSKINLQKNFYENYLDGAKERIVVIISDAMRYEIAKELTKDMNRYEKIEATIETQIGVLPSITRLGMASMLPHEKIEMDDNYSITVDGEACYTTAEREKILQKHNKNSVAIKFDKLNRYKRDELRSYFAGKNKVYVYQNQIDARGDEAKTEDEVFNAAQESIEEIIAMIRKLSENVSINNFIITSDHGFIYKRSQISESEKIEKFYEEADYKNRRFIISKNKYNILGTNNINMKEVIEGEGEKILTWPNTSNVFKMPGGGQNFYHGGCSPQELIIPVVKVKTIRNAVTTTSAEVKLISIINQLTNLNISLEFIQSKAISDIIKPATYRIFFEDEKEDVISNEEIVNANSTESESAKRIIKLRFDLKDQKYKKEDKYYLVVKSTQTGIEISRQPVMIDIAFSDGFGFDI